MGSDYAFGYGRESECNYSAQSLVVRAATDCLLGLVAVDLEGKRFRVRSRRFRTKLIPLQAGRSVIEPSEFINWPQGPVLLVAEFYEVRCLSGITGRLIVRREIRLKQGPSRRQLAVAR